MSYITNYRKVRPSEVQHLFVFLPEVKSSVGPSVTSVHREEEGITKETIHSASSSFFFTLDSHSNNLNFSDYELT